MSTSPAISMPMKQISAVPHRGVHVANGEETAG
jgi:hypothetical protein